MACILHGSICKYQVPTTLVQRPGPRHKTSPLKGSVGELVRFFERAGTYPFVTHMFRDAERDAAGLIEVA